MKVLMAGMAGMIVEKDYNEENDRLSKARVKEILKEAFSINGNVINIERATDEIDDIYKISFPKEINRDEIFVCIREMTPGGRSELKNEQRIQPQAQQINYIFNINNEGKKGILLGAYEREGEVIIVSWKANLSNASTPTTGVSKQIKINSISTAIKYGFVQVKPRKGDYVCVFRKEFIYFYINNSEWIHNNTIEELNNLNAVVIEEEESTDSVKNLDIKNRLNRIIFGAPGTGKSFRLNSDLKKYNLNKLFSRVTFHPNYTYAQFVGSYKPISKLNEENNIREVVYEFVPGPFLKVLINALKDKKNGIPHVLIIEEINRANPAAVFGDVFQLLDRNESGESSYKITVSKEMKEFLQSKDGLADRFNEILGQNSEEIYIPNNMYIWATMNSADQGVYPMDSAFKRRWSFEYISIDENEKELEANEYNIIKLKNGPKDSDYGTYSWNAVRKEINKNLKKLKVNEDKLLGPFFLSEIELSKSQDSQAEFDNIFKSKVLMYLYEDILKHKKGEFFATDDLTLSGIMKSYNEGHFFSFSLNEIYKDDNASEEENEVEFKV
ncbi:MAG: AAA family ATPase [Clostridium sp.]|uniref:AAA family ATPase n=1 Tax=Clostridium sp. TaxID=1506 RepID=UPI003999DBB4